MKRTETEDKNSKSTQTKQPRKKKISKRLPPPEKNPNHKNNYNQKSRTLRYDLRKARDPEYTSDTVQPW